MKMLKVLAACGNGMGSSLIIKMKIEKVLKDMGLDCEVHHASVGQAKSDARNFDLVLVSHMLVNEFSNVGKAKIIGLINLLSEQEIRDKVEAALNS
ncbi:MAG: PTS ascorbate transporter subunit IIB [Firmicutes bacterium HGW-Firmicutes-5]|nr:MAG: PTS ascorbate transporter subunit IIB [Firmicutes bacterium HGW-Firmicutes-5]